MEINKIEENIYEIPKEGEMKKPARVFASEKLLEKMKDDDTLRQVKNMATLPGLEKYSMVLPDGHQGYGFPIGGVAAFDNKKGVISPGGIGFDINCLTGDSEVLMEFGRKQEIENLKDKFAQEKVIVSSKESAVESSIQLFTETESQEVFKVEAETGETVKATKDHPFLTSHGMKKLSEIQEGEQIFIRPFEGVSTEEAEEFILLDRNDFEQENRQLVKALDDRDLLPLKSTDKEFNILLKLIGFHTGDGSFNNSGDTRFYAEREDLESIQNDIRELGFKPSKIYSREREHQVREDPFEVTETSIKSTSAALQKLMVKLGAPKGKKTQQSFTLPDYFEKLANWQRALYLSTFFGAEMSKPKAQHGKNLYCPKISQNKSFEAKESGKKFMLQIKKFLKDLGIETNKVEEFETHQNQDGKVMRYRLGVKNDSQNLIDLFQKIGYRYNKEKQREAIKASQYLKTKEKSIQRREQTAAKCVTMYEEGVKPKEIKSNFEINNRFIERSIYSGRETSSRPPENFPDYDEYAKDIEVRDDFSVKTTVKEITPAGKEKVYDIGVEHEAHNFQANKFIVSNCGVRVLKTDLSYEDIKGSEKQLANIIFSKIPCGLGGGGYIDTDEEDLQQILDNGMDWMLENGYAREDDLKRCEENGKLPGDYRKVPDKAVKRGLKQVGSLGSGNHFLEIQKVDEVFDNKKAESYGLEEDQVVIMIHSGSRGLGHETCTQYLRKFEKEYPGIAESLPEKNLMYAPLGDELAEDYRKAMYAAANYAWANRQGMTHGIRQVFNEFFEDVKVDLVYDVCHNIAKEEMHEVDGEEKELLVHRKGATRAFPAGREEVPEVYQDVGQPVLIPGTMGTHSYILSGGDGSLRKTFGSAAHGAGRLKSRTQAKKDYSSKRLQRDLETEDDVFVKARSGETVAEEAPGAYKDVDEVIQVTDQLNLGKKVAKMKPIVNIKG